MIDSGATSHIVNDRELLATSVPTESTINGIGGPNNSIRVLAEGTLHGFPGRAVYAPDSTLNMLSVGQLDTHGWPVKFANKTATITSDNGFSISGSYNPQHRLYITDDTALVAAATTKPTTPEGEMILHHQRLGHPSDERLRKACSAQGIDVSKWPRKLPLCVPCVEAKLHKARVTRSPTHSERDSQLRPGERFDLDLIGKLTRGLGGVRWAIRFIDRRTRMRFTETMTKKSAATKTTAAFLDRVLPPFSRTCRELHGDLAGEIKGEEWQQMCRERHITPTWAATDTPSHNGAVERSHRTSIESARALLYTAGLKEYFWPHALHHADYLQNRLPTRALNGMSPFEAWTGEKPDLSGLYAFGSKVFYYDPDGGKFGKRAQQGIYLGPAVNVTGGAILVYSPQTQRINVTRDFQIVEPPTNQQPEKENHIPGGVSDPVPTPEAAAEPPIEVRSDIPVKPAEPIDDDEGYAEIPESAPAAPPSQASPPPPAPPEPPEPPDTSKQRRKDRLRRELAIDMSFTPRRPHPHNPQPDPDPGERALISTGDPASASDALSRPDHHEWRAAMLAEIQALVAQQVFTIVRRDKNTRTVHSKFVLTQKTDENNNPTRKKARLVARGHTQKPGVDFYETSSPVVEKESIRTITAVSAATGNALYGFDVHTAYLYALLDETIHMSIPDGFLQVYGDHLTPQQRELLTNGHGVLRLHKALYGLKQSGRNWYLHFREVLAALNYQPTRVDPCVFVNNAGGILGIHVDDGLATGPPDVMAALRDGLAGHVDIKWQEKPTHFLGWTFNYLPDGSIHVHQRGYIEQMAANYGDGRHPPSTPLVYGTTLDNQGDACDATLYRGIVGSLNFAAVSTRPDIATAVSLLSRHLEAPTEPLLKAARNTVAYLAATADYGILYPRRSGPMTIELYSDASFAPNEDGRRSREGNLVLLNGAPTAWKSKLQRSVATSTAEAEYMAASAGVKLALPLQQLLGELHVDTPPVLPLHEDNDAAAKMASEVATKRAKHIDVAYHHLRDLVLSGRVSVHRCATQDMLADALTKILPRSRFQDLRARFMSKGECGEN